nr:hypothetical protein CFP56_28786 [Quercus suber]
MYIWIDEFQNGTTSPWESKRRRGVGEEVEGGGDGGEEGQMSVSRGVAAARNFEALARTRTQSEEETCTRATGRCNAKVRAERERWTWHGLEVVVVRATTSTFDSQDLTAAVVRQRSTQTSLQLSLIARLVVGSRT